MTLLEQVLFLLKLLLLQQTRSDKRLLDFSHSGRVQVHVGDGAGDQLTSDAERLLSAAAFRPPLRWNDHSIRSIAFSPRRKLLTEKGGSHEDWPVLPIETGAS